MREDGTRLEQLERLLDVRQALADQQFLTATVVMRDPNNLRQIVAIDRGRNHGIRVGMPVVTEGQTLVGTVTRVESNHSWVTLVTDVDSAVSAVVAESRAQGVVTGSYTRRLTMEFVTQDAPVREGDTVMTSGITGTYPAGLVIGRVTGVSGTRQDIFRRVTVEPLASLSRLETLLVMTSFSPLQITLP